MAGFTKLFNSILQSTIWTEPNDVRILWITMLAMADRDGHVDSSIPGLARMAGITIEETQAALEKFQSPDPYSRTPDNEGRRISKIVGGWLLLNHTKYRALLSIDERREYNKVKQAEHRKKVKSREAGEDSPMPSPTGFIYYAAHNDRVKIGFSKNPSARVWGFRTTIPGIGLLAVEPGTLELETERHAQFKKFWIELEWFKLDGALKDHVERLAKNGLPSTTVIDSQSQSAMSAHTEADADTKASTPKAPQGVSSSFVEFWNAYPRRVGKATALRAFNRKHCSTFMTKILAAITAQRESEQWRKDGGAFIPYPASWINRDGWDDEIKTSPMMRL